MENELQILNNIEKNRKATQRDIARVTGMSLGNVNILIKRLVRKGLLKIERLNPRTIRYILTPAGLKEKAELTYRYIVDSCRLINEFCGRIEAMVASGAFEGRPVMLFGEDDEMFRLIVGRLDHAGICCRRASTIEELESLMPAIVHAAVIVWRQDYADLLSGRNIEHINIMNGM